MGVALGHNWGRAFGLIPEDVEDDLGVRWVECEANERKESTLQMHTRVGG